MMPRATSISLSTTSRANPRLRPRTPQLPTNKPKQSTREVRANDSPSPPVYGGTHSGAVQHVRNQRQRRFGARSVWGLDPGSQLNPPSGTQRGAHHVYTGAV